MSGRKQITSRIKEFVQASSRRCHAIGLVLSVIVTGLIVWTSDRGDALWSGKSAPDAITAYEASYVCEHSQELRNKHAEALKREKGFRRRVDELAIWVAKAQDWEFETRKITAVAQSAGLLIGEFSEPKSVSGFRVGVTQTSFAVTGDFAAICKFIETLSQGERPVWCTRASIQPMSRLDEPSDRPVQLPVSDQPADAAGEGDADANNHLATANLTIRIPFADASSAAGKLGLSEPTNGN